MSTVNNTLPSTNALGFDNLDEISLESPDTQKVASQVLEGSYFNESAWEASESDIKAIEAETEGTLPDLDISDSCVASSEAPKKTNRIAKALIVISLCALTALIIAIIAIGIAAFIMLAPIGL